jgi:hypothetical protein
MRNNHQLSETQKEKTNPVFSAKDREALLLIHEPINLQKIKSSRTEKNKKHYIAPSKVPKMGILSSLIPRGQSKVRGIIVDANSVRLWRRF